MAGNKIKWLEDLKYCKNIIFPRCDTATKYPTFFKHSPS